MRATEEDSGKSLSQLELFFRPSSVAVIGVSTMRGKIGHEILRSIVDGGYQGKIYPVTISAKEILGLKCYESVLQIPEPVDLAVYALPSNLAPKIIEECGQKGVKNIIIVSGGFKEVGGSNVDLESEVVKIARRYGMRIIGPNCIGVFDGKSRFDTFFQSHERMVRPPHGPLSFITQSGTYGVAFLEEAAEDGVGVSKMVSFGNKADVDEADLVRYLGADEDTRVIAIYMEAVVNGRRFIEAVSEVAAKKPIVILKSGRTSLGVKAARSHTGWLAGSYQVARSIFKQAGIVVAEDFEEMYDCAKALALQPLPRGRRVGMLTNGAGMTVSACDAAEQRGIFVGTYSEETKKKLEEALPKFALVREVVDLTGSATSKEYKITMESLLSDDGIDLVMPFFVFQDTPLDEGIIDVLPEMQRYGKPILGVYSRGIYGREVARKLQMRGIPLYRSPERAVAVASHMMWLSEYRATLDKRAIIKTPEPATRPGETHKLISSALREGRNLLLEHEGKELLRSYGIPVAESSLSKNEEEAAELAESMGYPVVLKIVSQDIIHKSDVGGVVVGLNDREEVKKAYRTILENVKKKAPGSRISGILVQRMAPQGLEVIVGGIRDEEFGPVVMFGLGGIFVELMRDVTFRKAAITKFEALEMIREIRGYQVLRGFRGQPPVKEEAIAEILTKLSHLLLEQPKIREIDLNPVFAYPDSAIVADVRILLE
ncbi:MAG: acetate--CoA ligase family protein [Nitrososphaerota archaeon]